MGRSPLLSLLKPLVMPALLAAVLAHSYATELVAAPGQVVGVDRFVEGGSGDLLVTAVAIRRADPVALVRARLDGAAHVVSKQDPQGRDRDYYAGQMETSKSEALAAALGFLDARPEDVVGPTRHSAGIMGPSAGLMLALGIVDTNTADDLTGGRRIAGTGTITPEGVVGAVWGIGYKVAGAERAGAEVFLVPTEQLQQARAAAVHIDVVGVTTLAEAVAVLMG